MRGLTGKVIQAFTHGLDWSALREMENLFSTEMNALLLIEEEINSKADLCEKMEWDKVLKKLIRIARPHLNVDPVTFIPKLQRRLDTIFASPQDNVVEAPNFTNMPQWFPRAYYMLAVFISINWGYEDFLQPINDKNIWHFDVYMQRQSSALWYMPLYEAKILLDNIYPTLWIRPAWELISRTALVTALANKYPFLVDDPHIKPFLPDDFTPGQSSVMQIEDGGGEPSETVPLA